MALTLLTSRGPPVYGMENAALAPAGTILSRVKPNWSPMALPALSVSETATCTPSTGALEALRTSPTTTGPIDVGRVFTETTESRWSVLWMLSLTVAPPCEQETAASIPTKSSATLNRTCIVVCYRPLSVR